MKWTVRKFRQCKGGEPLGLVTAYDFLTARMAQRAGVPLVLVGDSLATTALGHPTTLPATMDVMVHHAEAVRRGAPTTFIIGDMPFGSYNESVEEAIHNANRFMMEIGCDAIKLEGGAKYAPMIKELVKAGIPVCGHIGLTPQTTTSLGGFKVQGGTPESAKQLIEDAKALEEAGYTKVILRPLMVVAGDHANNDMAGDEEGSWYYGFVNGGEFEVEGADEVLLARFTRGILQPSGGS